jgi:hypothetical protein
MSLLVLLTTGMTFAASFLLMGGLVELRQGRRLLAAGPKGLRATVAASHGVLEAPLSKRACVLFSLTLTRKRAQERFPGGVLAFSEQRAFALVGHGPHAGKRFAVDPAQKPVVLLGFPIVEKALPHLPTAIVGLLVQRFGRKGQLWAEDYAVTARESILGVGDEVHGLVEDGVVRLLSPEPLGALGRAAWRRGRNGLIAGVVLLALAPLVRHLLG